MFKKLLLSNKNSGMTFIELIVVMGIFTAISATVLFNYRDFSDGVALQNLSQEIALQGKRAQTLASQGRRPVLTIDQINNTAGLLPDDWVSSYGIAFDVVEHPKSFMFYFNSPVYYEFFDSETSAERNLYFRDFVDMTYGGCGQATSECIEEIVITDGSYIDLICIDAEPQINPNCDTGVGFSAEQIHISYTRPQLEAYILAFGGDTPTPDPGEFAYTAAYGFIRVVSRDGDQKRYITFWTTGQISVN